MIRAAYLSTWISVIVCHPQGIRTFLSLRTDFIQLHPRWYISPCKHRLSLFKFLPSPEPRCGREFRTIKAFPVYLAHRLRFSIYQLCLQRSRKPNSFICIRQPVEKNIQTPPLPASWTYSGLHLSSKFCRDFLGRCLHLFRQSRKTLGCSGNQLLAFPFPAFHIEWDFVTGSTIGGSVVQCPS